MQTEFLPGTPKNWKDLKPHPLSALVEFGAGIDVSALAAHMRQHGYDQEEAIVLYEGQILDGRHKHIAAQEAEVVPTFRRFTGPDPLAYVAKKIYRQHLTASQKAQFAAKMVKLSTCGVSHPANLPDQKCPPGQVANYGENGRISQEKAAHAMGVSERSVRDAVKVEEKCTAEVVGAVMDGTIKGHDAAKIKDHPPHVQNGAVHAVRNGKAKTAAAAIKDIDREPGCEPDPEVDHFKKPVPEEINDVFATVPAYRSALHALAKVRQAVEKISNGKGKRFLDSQEVDRLIKQAHATLRFAMPYTECVKCRRKIDKNCKHCRGGGWLNETTFKACASDDDKKWLEARKP